MKKNCEEKILQQAQVKQAGFYRENLRKKKRELRVTAQKEMGFF